MVVARMCQSVVVARRRLSRRLMRACMANDLEDEAAGPRDGSTKGEWRRIWDWRRRRIGDRGGGSDDDGGSAWRGERVRRGRRITVAAVGREELETTPTLNPRLELVFEPEPEPEPCLCSRRSLPINPYSGRASPPLPFRRSPGGGEDPLVAKRASHRSIPRRLRFSPPSGDLAGSAATSLCPKPVAPVAPGPHQPSSFSSTRRSFRRRVPSPLPERPTLLPPPVLRPLPADFGCLAAQALLYENQKLVKQLEEQKSEMRLLEGKLEELRDEQCSYDNSLISLNKMWNQLIDDLILLGVRACGNIKNLQALDHEELSEESLQTCPSEEIFLLRLLNTSNFRNNDGSSLSKFVEEALALRYSTTATLMKSLQEAFAVQQARSESLSLALNGANSIEDVTLALENHNDYLKEVVDNLHQAISIINEKHERNLDEIEAFKSNHSREQHELKCLSGELEESMAELEESRRKLAVLQLQSGGGSLMNTSASNGVNGSVSTDKSSDKGMDWRDLKDAVEEAKTLAANRLFELHETQEDNLTLSKQLEDLQDQLKDENYIFVSKPYTILNDQLHHLNAEVERHRGLVEVLQNERDQFMQKEKEMLAREESVETIQQSITNYDATIEELEHEMQKLMAEKYDLEIKVEEALQDSGKKDFKDEIHVMAASLSKEMELLENQLNRSKDAASEAHALREKADYLRSLLAKRTDEQKEIAGRYNTQVTEIKSLKALIETLDQEKQELQFIVDMLGKECSESRPIEEIEESENRAREQAEYLRKYLEDHNLELRVKAANEAETACQQRLSIAEIELEDLRAKVDASERDVLILKESIRIIEAERDGHICEIETIGQAYEDMQTQNQHLLQQVADRDDLNIKLVSDSVKMKQAYGSLLAENQIFQKKLQHVNSSLESCKQKITCGEEKMKTYVAQAMKSSSENRHTAISLERPMLEVSDAEKELRWLRSTTGFAEKEYETNQKKIAELKLELEQERSERARLEEEYEEVKNEVTELTSETEETTIQKLQNEINECKAILKCGVCFDRPKEVVITKCFHLFCSPCIQRNLEIRHRKCPGCGTPFGQSDVREVKI
uniref:E3 ubiquitin protein ligase n=1 Tax=Leersia perrieri TaxID=77586 RepID=A0A0D9XLD6_9ORYZ